MFRGPNQHNDRENLKAQFYIEVHYTEDLGVEQVAKRVNMSRRNLVRRFKQATHHTPLEYIQRVKIKVARKAMQNSLTQSPMASVTGQ